MSSCDINVIAGPKLPSPWLDVRHFCRPEASLGGDLLANIEGEASDVPDDAWVRDSGPQCAIDAVSVHIINKSSCLVSVPVAAHQLAECTKGSMSAGGRTRLELTWLARLLSRSTTESLRKSRAWGRLEDAWHGKLKDIDVLHKYEQYLFLKLYHTGNLLQNTCLF